MTFDEFTDALYAAGWTSQNDAQHENIKTLWLQIAVDAGYHAKWCVADEKLLGILALCNAAKGEGWEHLSINAINAMAFFGPKA